MDEELIWRLWNIEDEYQEIKERKNLLLNDLNRL